MNDQFDNLKKEISELIKNKKYDQILNKLDLFEESNSININSKETSKNDLSNRFEKEIFESILDVTPTGICIVTTEKHLFVNKAWQDIMGYTDEEAYGMSPLEVIHPDMRELVEKRSKLRLKGKKVPERYDIKINTKNNSTKWIDISFSKIQFEHQVATLGIFNDITEIKNTREALIKSEDKFRKLTELSPAAICIQTTDKFLWANSAWSEISGYPLKEVLKMGPLDIIHPDMREIAKERSDARLSNEDVIKRYNLKILTKDKQVKWVDIAISVIEFEGETASLAVSSDITKQVDARRALKESEEKFRQFTELSPVAVAIQTTQKLLFVNPAWCTISGYTEKEALTMSPIDLVHPDMKSLLQDRSDKRLKGDDVISNYEIKILTKVQKVKWINTSMSRIEFEGKFANLAVSVDVTEVKKIQQALKESEEKYRSLIENLRLEYFFYRHNADGYFEYVSPSIENILGYTQNEFLTHYTKHLTNKSENKLAIEKTELSIKGIQQEPYELEIYDINKIVHLIEISETPIIDSNENVIGVDGIAHDITLRKRAEKELQESRELYQKLVNNQGEALVIVNNNNDFTFGNPAAHEIFGVAKGKLVGRSVKEFITDKYVGIVRDQTDKRKTGIKNTYELEIQRPDNLKRFILVTASPEYNEENEIIGAFAIFRDITERKKTENALIKSELELRKSNAQKDKFFSLIAHDLRSPIGNFVQISELLKSNYEELPKEQINEFFDNLHNLADRTFTLLENLLMWSRSQLGRLEIIKKEFELSKIVDEVAELYEENFNTKNIKFINEIPQDLKVKTDLNIIHTVLRNLISNAIKFSNSGGNITVSNTVEINKLNNTEDYIISIKDIGVGIPRNKIDKIFSLDDEYSTLGTDREKGTGLGLILCKELIEKNGGKIWVQSKKGKGSEFCFTLKR